MSKVNFLFSLDVKEGRLLGEDMNFNNSLELVQSQKLIMTTQLKQSLNILNMSKLELEEEIKKESEENPLLEVEKNNEINWEEYIKNIGNSRPIDKSELYYNSDDDLNLDNIIKNTPNLYENLHLQINLYKINKKDKEICDYIIDSLDDDGYLRIDEKEIINEFNINKDIFENCLEIIQQLEPIGVGARNLSECLIIQIRNLGIDNKLLETIVYKDLDLIGKNKYKEITKKYNISMQKCINIIDIIKTLDPKPGRICSVENSVYVQPDVIVEKIEDEFVVYINESDNLKIRISNFYEEILKNSKYDESAKNYIKEKLNSATRLVKSIESRKSTILKIAQEIVKNQKDFFEKGEKYIKPMKMKDIAQNLDFHESTISRGVNEKYMMTPFGLYKFRYFFSNALETNDDNLTSSVSIKKIIQEMIKSENKKKPLSDDQISKILNDRGINVARRTVAKYREELGILSSSKRKLY
ncbi:RNA polymerase factor sigma-54 [Romboutsia ilealis]|uniref:RNA polymerase factor sigma-54 n=1 Tax=Romboutsia ilealis TaxID=1115758 RepID=UPI0025744FBF|nr:RNA polymerase factor sigma-54 [Romboutsia ilealis]